MPTVGFSVESADSAAQQPTFLLSVEPALERSNNSAIGPTNGTSDLPAQFIAVSPAVETTISTAVCNAERSTII